MTMKRKLEDINQQRNLYRCLKTTIIETIRLNRLHWFGHVQRTEKKIEYQKGCYIWIWKQQGWEVDQEIDGKMRWQRMEEKLVEKGGKKNYITQEWKTLLTKARNCCILHMPMEWMNEWFQSLSSHTKMCISGRAPSRKHPITGTFTAHSSAVSPGCGNCWMSHFWQLKFRGDSWVFRKFVNPCSNFSLIPYTGYWKIPNLTC